MSSEKRKYELKVRAERQRETRERIGAATCALHEEVGPARTTVAEIARRAGVQRLTVYNNFPNEEELFAACQRHFYAEHPPPDLERALVLEDPSQRLWAVLNKLYPWYRATQRILGNVQRDRSIVPALDSLLARTDDVSLAVLVDALVAGWSPRGDQEARLRAAIAVVLDFWTWQRVAQEGLDDEAAAELMAHVGSAAATARPRRARAARAALKRTRGDSR
jgi:AcrR family transcriptional regulator